MIYSRKFLFNDPVSYTHLDVYKRQVYASALTEKSHSILNMKVDLQQKIPV
ncbi:hypothetical protein [Erwinia amylovora]